MLATNLKQAFCMPVTAPAYPAPPFRYEGCRWTMVLFRTEQYIIQSLVPEPLVPDPAPVMGLYVAQLSIAAPLASTYYEAGLVARVTFQHKPGLYFAALYLDSPLGVVVGREIWGFPKKPAQITYNEEDGQISAIVSMMNSPLIKIGMRQARRVEHFPEDTIQAGYTLKVIPAAKREAVPDVLKLVALPHDMQIKEMYEGPGTLELLPSPYDSLANIPVLEVVGATFQIIDMTLDWGEVVLDYLSEQIEAREPVAA